MNILKDIGSAIAGVAPVLANALLPGVGGVVAGAAVSAISKAIGVESDPDVVKKALLGSLSPEQMTALKKADNEFQIQMRELDVDLEKVHAADRDSARRLQGRTKSLVVPVLATVITLATLAMFGYVLTMDAAVELSNGSMLVIGHLSGMFSTVTAFYFGSSKKEADRTEGS